MCPPHHPKILGKAKLLPFSLPNTSSSGIHQNHARRIIFHKVSARPVCNSYMLVRVVFFPSHFFGSPHKVDGLRDFSLLSCPLSPLRKTIVMEPLFRVIKQEGGEDKKASR
jgi:hypothetical protein